MAQGRRTRGQLSALFFFFLCLLLCTYARATAVTFYSCYFNWNTVALLLLQDREKAPYGKLRSRNLEGEWNVNIIGLLFDHLKELFPRYKLLTFQQQPEDNTKNWRESKEYSDNIIDSQVKSYWVPCKASSHRIRTYYETCAKYKWNWLVRRWRQCEFIKPIGIIIWLYLCSLFSLLCARCSTASSFGVTYRR